MDKKNKKDNNLLTALKGLIIGGTMLVPGVSGGSMAMILGIYDRLISSVSSFMKNKKENLIFLVIFSMGGILGILLFANPLLQLIERYPMPMMYFFIGAVAGGVPLIVRQSGAKKLTWRIAGYVVLGLIAVLALGLLPPDLFSAENSTGVTGFLLLLVAGFVTAAALVLPGVSVSYLLLILGLYDRTMNAISTLHLPFLLPLGIGLVLGIVLITRALERALESHPHPSYFIILGFLLGSVFEIFPGIPQGILLPVCILTFAAGFSAIFFLSRMETKKEGAVGK
ncbi:DUF368 domain-containing protein [Mediterraneibacter glycyrrhizinilyticus]|nr:DUF368 domain-containing protein [Mediterraneibacter glycyrrhizinilyticus]MBM6855370.1 DUF368 domain-containing protein [Mediterraneibacter glycyrrhizinilyticus]